ncbi:MAG: nickel-dependent lactate racemase [Candidatus Lokiarchaeota archaeon]|nr:nickel-dependent lactate racemase [Candidatus Lokiarchaeota archaeon]
MSSFKIPYGTKELEINIEPNVEIELIKPKDAKCSLDCVKSLQDALENPINTKPFSEIISDKPKKIVFVIDDYTRKFPNVLIIPPILDILKNRGILKENITFLMGCGTHKEPNQEHIKKLFFDKNGKNVLEGYRLVWNDIHKSKFKNIGTTSRGTPIEINEEYLNSDIRILLTDLQYHYYAGFGGDRKSILPGVASEKAIDRNHSLLIDPKAKAGNLNGNPIHLDMLEIAQKVGVDFVVNVITDLNNEIIDIKAGALNDAFLEAIKIYDSSYKIELTSKSDMIILSAGGYPKDINLYQALKGLEHCRSAVKDNGFIFFIAECNEGIGHQVFDEWMDKYNTLEKVSKQLQTKFKMGGHKVYYLLLAKKQTPNIFLLSKLPENQVKNKFFLTPISDEKSLERIINDTIKKNNIKKIYLIPNGGDILIEIK